MIVQFLIYGPEIVDKRLKKSLYSLYDITTVALKKKKNCSQESYFFLVHYISNDHYEFYKKERPQARV